MQQMAELKKENFGLKLRIYHLEEALQKKAGAGNEDWEMVCVLATVKPLSHFVFLPV